MSLAKGTAMTEDEFRALAAEQGYDELRAVDYEPTADGELHSHEFSALMLVTEGEFTLVYESGSDTFGPGQTCELTAGTMHFERTGEQGATLLAGVKSSSP